MTWRLVLVAPPRNGCAQGPTVDEPRLADTAAEAVAGPFREPVLLRSLARLSSNSRAAEPGVSDPIGWARSTGWGP